MTARSEAATAIMETVNDLHDIGFVDKETVRSFSLRCQLPEIPQYGAQDIRALREKLNVSQAVMASLLNATSSTVQKWEQGLKRPNALALKLLNILDRHGIQALL